MASDLTVGKTITEEGRVFKSAADALISFGDNSVNWAIGIDQSESQFQINKTSAMGSNQVIVCDSAGNVGIGVTPEALLSFSAAEIDNVKIRFQNAHSVTNDAGISTYDDTAGTELVIGTNLYIDSGGNLQRWNTGDQSSYLYLGRAGNVYLGTGETGATATARLKIDSAGLATFYNGIAFQSATTGTGTGTNYSLDSYECGTWTPTNGNFTTWTSPVFTATYVKIGKLVQVNCLQTGGTIDPGGTLKTIGGFPFAAANRATCVLSNDGPTDLGHGYVYNNSTMYVVSNIGSQTSFSFSAVYMTA